MQVPIRRVLAIDAGQRRIKLVLADSAFGRLSTTRRELIDLKSEGLVSPEEIQAQLQDVLDELGHPPLALVLPQHLSISQSLDLPQAPESEVEKLIADEAVKLGGVTESRIVYDFVRTDSGSRNRQRFWVTLCKEEDIRDHIERLGLAREDLCEITTTANSLIAAWQAQSPESANAVLVHVGAQSTVVIVMMEGQGAFTASFQMGGDFLTRSLARLRECSEEAAEEMRRSRNLFSGPDVVPAFVPVVDGWASELRQQVREWFAQNPASPPMSEYELVATGGAFEEPGLLEHLREHAGLDFHLWPTDQPGSGIEARGFEVACGAALQALGFSRQSVSLLPEDYRAAWSRRLRRQRIDIASLVLVALCAVVLAFGTWRKLSLIGLKEAMRAKVQAAQEAADFNDSLTVDLLSEYEALRPVFAGQQASIDTLKTLALLQQARSNRAFWFVLVSDQESYFISPPAQLATNRPARTNLLGPVESLRAPAISPRSAMAAVTNTSLAKPGLIVELCVPGEAEPARGTLSELVKDLKQQALFSKVDLLSEDLRRSLADPKVVVPDRHFVLALDFARSDYAQPIKPKRQVQRSTRHTARPSTGPTENIFPATPTATP